MVYLATNETPHERLVWFSQRVMTRTSLPSWLLIPGPVLLRRFMQRKDYPLTDEVGLVEANSSYVVVRFTDKRESSVSASDLAPLLESPVGLVDTPPGRVFDNVRCHQPELSPDTVDSDANSNVDTGPAGSHAKPPEMCLYIGRTIHRWALAKMYAVTRPLLSVHELDRQSLTSRQWCHSWEQQDQPFTFCRRFHRC